MRGFFTVLCSGVLTGDRAAEDLRSVPRRGAMTRWDSCYTASDLGGFVKRCWTRKVVVGFVYFELAQFA